VFVFFKIYFNCNIKQLNVVACD